ncbi:hypothetical protein ACFL2Y_04565 [Candidatus Omnitrophota bacterium]
MCAKKIKKMRRAKNNVFKVVKAVVLLCFLYFGIKCFVFAEEVAVETQQEVIAEAESTASVPEEALPVIEEATQEVGQVQDTAEVAEPSEQPVVESEVLQEEAEPKANGLVDLMPEGVVYDPEGESFATIHGQVVKEGEYFEGFLLESITPNTVLFSNEAEEYEIPVRSVNRLTSVINNFKDIYVDGLLYDDEGESFVVINSAVAREGDTVGGFLVESIGDSIVILRQDDLRFEVSIPHFEEEQAEPIKADTLVEAEPIQVDASLVDVKPNAITLDAAVPMVIGE